MEEQITLFVTSVRDFKTEAENFYKDCARETILQDSDLLLIAFIDADIAGVVRLCFENEVFVLRTMQVHPDHQRRGLGSIMLERFEELLKEKKIEKTFCMPYAHLESFYGQIGFKAISLEEAPFFLQERVREFRAKRPTQSVLLMARVIFPKAH